MLTNIFEITEWHAARLDNAKVSTGQSIVSSMAWSRYHLLPLPGGMWIVLRSKQQRIEVDHVGEKGMMGCVLEHV